MPEFVTLACPSCGGKLNITPDIDRFACAHCGHEHIVKRGGGLIRLMPIVDAIETVRIGVDKTAAELALVRLDRELEQLEERREQVILSTPRPNESDIPTFLFLAAIVLVFISITGQISEVPAFLAALVCVVIAVASKSSHSSAVLQWQATRDERLAPIDAEIAKREEEKAACLRTIQFMTPSNHEESVRERKMAGHGRRRVSGRP